MKKITSLLLALFSALFLAVSESHAAERFDTIGNAKHTTFSDTVNDGDGVGPGILPD